MVNLILHNGKLTTLDPARPLATAVAISGGSVTAVGDDDEIMGLAGKDTKVVDLGGRRVIPGLNDSHTHLIRGGLNFNLELCWEGVPSVIDALEMLRAQALRTPAPQWVRVVGGWSEFQFVERRMPTLEEINKAAPDTDDIDRLRGAETKSIDVEGRRVIPGLVDSHLHAVRGGRFYAAELRWDGVRSLQRALEMVREQDTTHPSRRVGTCRRRSRGARRRSVRRHGSRASAARARVVAGTLLRRIRKTLKGVQRWA